VGKESIAVVAPFYSYLLGHSRCSDSVDRFVWILHWVHHTWTPPALLGQGTSSATIDSDFLAVPTPTPLLQACRAKWGALGEQTQYTWHFSKPFYVWTIICAVFLGFLFTVIELIIGPKYGF
jgi:hypothetical protein